MFVSWNRMSDWPSPLKSPVPLASQLAPTGGPIRAWLMAVVPSTMR